MNGLDDPTVSDHSLLRSLSVGQFRVLMAQCLFDHAATERMASLDGRARPEMPGQIPVRPLDKGILRGDIPPSIGWPSGVQVTFA